MTNKSFLMYGLLAALSFLPIGVSAQNGAPKEQQIDIDYIVAVVNSIPITRNDVRIRQTRLEAQWAAQGTQTPPTAELFGQVLNRLIEERVVLNLAHDLGIKVSPDQLSEALLGVALESQLSSVSELQTQYEKSGRNWKAYTQEVREQLMMQQVRDREVNNRTRVSEAEITAAINESDLVGTRVNRINVAHILVALPEKPSAADVGSAQNKATALLARARGGEDFSKLAASFSEAPNAAKDGGVMGLRTSDRYPDLFAQAVRQLDVNAITEPIRSDAGFHILKLLQRQSQTIETVRQTQVRHILLTPTSTLSEAQAKARLIAIKSKIELKQSTFESEAREHSVDSSAAQGGNLDWAAPGQFVPEFEQIMNDLAVGQVSMPFTSRFGVHILEVTNRRDVALTEREQRERVADRLRSKKMAENYVQWLTDMRGRAFIELRNP
jgi:peptidyl-prolyl cis-trans isomerase SurA